MIPHTPEFWLRALREYSEQCDAPDLTPGCPYRRVSENIGAWCLDECVDLLAKHDAPPPLERELRAGDMTIIKARHPRIRRNLIRPKAPFDVREQFLADACLPLSQRRTTALMYELSQFVASPRVGGEDEAEIDATDPVEIMRELSRRGFDAEALVREGLGHEIGSRLLRRLLCPRSLVPRMTKML